MIILHIKFSKGFCSSKKTNMTNFYFPFFFYFKFSPEFTAVTPCCNYDFHLFYETFFSVGLRVWLI